MEGRFREVGGTASRAQREVGGFTWKSRPAVPRVGSCVDMEGKEEKEEAEYLWRAEESKICGSEEHGNLLAPLWGVEKGIGA